MKKGSTTIHEKSFIFSYTYSEERESEFRRLLKETRGFEINEVEPDGACLFRSVSDQVNYRLS